MPASYHINENDGLITLTVTGRVNIADVHAAAGALIGDPEYDPSLPQLMDLRGMELDPPNEESQKPFSRFVLRSYAPSSRACIAMVIDPELDAQTCAGAYWVSCAVGNSELFDNYELALKWLVKKEFSAAAQASGC